MDFLSTAFPWIALLFIALPICFLIAAGLGQWLRKDVHCAACLYGWPCECDAIDLAENGHCYHTHDEVCSCHSSKAISNFAEAEHASFEDTTDENPSKDLYLKHGGNSHDRRKFRRNTILLTLVLISGCSSMPGLYAELGGGIKERSSYVYKPECHAVIHSEYLTDRSCGGDRLIGKTTIGFEFREGSVIRPDRCEIWAHTSSPFDGGDDREIWIENGACYWRFGGRQ